VVSRQQLEDSVYGWARSRSKLRRVTCTTCGASSTQPSSATFARGLPRRSTRLKSIRRHSCLAHGALALGIAAVALATYYAALQQIGALFDAALTQIAQAVHLREDWAEAANVRIARRGRFAVRAYDDGGRVFFETPASLPPDAPKTPIPDQCVDTPDGPWRVYTSHPEAHQVPGGSRARCAGRSFATHAAPELLFVAGAALLVAWILKRALAPLDQTQCACESATRALDPLPTESVAEESPCSSSR